MSLSIWAKLAIAIGVFLASFTLLSGYSFTYATGIQDWTNWPQFQWWIWYWKWSDEKAVAWWLWVTGGLSATLSGALMLLPLVYRPAALLPSGMPAYSLLNPSRLGSWFRRAAAPLKPIPSGTPNFGTARELTPEERREKWSGIHPVHGAIVVAEDWDPRERRRPYRSRNPKTWGRGGKAPLLTDDCTEGSPHHLEVSGTRSGKSMGLVTTLASPWRSSVVCLDPALEVTPMVLDARRAMGHDVYVLSLETAADCGLNPFSLIDINSPAAETDIRELVDWVMGYTSKVNDNHGYFKESGKALAACFAAHIAWHPTAALEVRTLRSLRRMIVPTRRAALEGSPEERAEQRGIVLKRLQRIAETSPSSYARDLASEHLDAPSETFGSFLLNAARDTDWLSVRAYADLVSGTKLNPKQILNGKTDVFICLPSKLLNSADAVARCLIGPLMRACYDAGNATHPLVFFPIDELYKLGRMAIIEQARDDAAKFGIVMRGIYQSLGQIEQQWGGPSGLDAWLDACGWISYGAIGSNRTAQLVSDRMGTYGILVRGDSTNRGRPGGLGFRWLSRGVGSTVNETPHPVLSKSDVLRIPADARIVIPRNGDGAVLSAPFCYRRQEAVYRNLKPSPYFKASEQTALAIIEERDDGGTAN